MKNNNQSHTCPVCNKYLFKKVYSYEICPICGWEDDTAFEDTPDISSSANHISLNAYKKKYLSIIEQKRDYIWGNSINDTGETTN